MSVMKNQIDIVKKGKTMEPPRKDPVHNGQKLVEEAK